MFKNFLLALSFPGASANFAHVTYQPLLLTYACLSLRFKVRPNNSLPLARTINSIVGGLTNKRREDWRFENHFVLVGDYNLSIVWFGNYINSAIQVSPAIFNIKPFPRLSLPLPETQNSTLIHHDNNVPPLPRRRSKPRFQGKGWRDPEL